MFFRFSQAEDKIINLQKGGIMAYIGVDLHTNRLTAHFKNSENKAKSASYYIDDKDMNRFIEVLKKDDHVFIEASTNTFAFSDVIKDRVKKVTVIDPFQFRVIADSGKKTDKIDAKKIAEMGKYHVETGEDFLPEVYIVDEKIRRLRSLFTTYNLITKESTMTRNRIFSLFKQNLKPFTRQYIFTIVRYDLDAAGLAEEYRLQIKVLFDILTCLEEKKVEIKKDILVCGETYQEDIDILVSISGVSVFIALGLISDYGIIDRFQNAKEFSKYLRSTPRSEISNKKRIDGKTHKSGRKLSVKLILQGMHHSLKRNPYMNNFYWRLKKGKGACKARMAVARKIFVTMFYMLKKQEYYRYMSKQLHDRKMKEYQLFLKKHKRA